MVDTFPFFFLLFLFHRASFPTLRLCLLFPISLSVFVLYALLRAGCDSDQIVVAVDIQVQNT